MQASKHSQESRVCAARLQQSRPPFLSDSVCLSSPSPFSLFCNDLNSSWLNLFISRAVSPMHSVPQGFLRTSTIWSLRGNAHCPNHIVTRRTIRKRQDQCLTDSRWRGKCPQETVPQERGKQKQLGVGVGLHWLAAPEPRKVYRPSAI